MIKKILVAFIGCIIFSAAFSGVEDIHNTEKVERLAVPRYIVESFLYESEYFKNKSDVIKPMMDLYDAYINQVGEQTLSVREFYAICKRGGINNHGECWDVFVHPIMVEMKKYHFGNVCLGEIQGGNQYCVDDVFVVKEGGKNPYHQHVIVPEYTAYGLAFEYAKKQGHEVWCQSNGRSRSNLPINCTTLDNKNFYTFKFAGTHNTDDETIENNVIRGICALTDSKYVSSGYHDTSYSFKSGLRVHIEDNDGCLTKCDGNLLGNFALYGANQRRSFDWMEDKGIKDFCSISSHKVIGNNSLKRYPGYEYMTDAFANVQFVLDNYLIKALRAYVEVQGITVSEFDCNYKSLPMDTWDAEGTLNTLGDMINPYPDDVLHCKLNGKDIDFVFDDLYESEKFEQDAGEAGIGCVLFNGTYGADRNCKHLTEAQCKEANAIISGGTRWDKDAEICVLKDVETAKSITNTRQIVGGVLLAVAVTAASGGSALVVLVAATSSVAVDVAFVVLDRLNELHPAHRARAFAKDAQACKIPVDTTYCTSEQKRCAYNVVQNHFAELDSVFEDLNNDQLKEVGDLMENVTDCLSDEEFNSAINTSNASYTKALSIASVALIAGSFISPESFLARSAKYAPKLVKILSRGRIIERTSSSLDGAKYIRMYVDNLDDARVLQIADELRQSGKYVAGHMTETGRRFLGVSDNNIFKKWDMAPENWFVKLSKNRVATSRNWLKKQVVSGRTGLDLAEVLNEAGMRFYRFEPDGFVGVKYRSGEQCATGLKFHVSVAKSDLEKSAFIIDDLVKRSDAVDTWKVFLSGMDGMETGKDFTIFVSEQGYNKAKIQIFLADLENELKANGVKSNGFGQDIISGDKRVSGSNYTNYRYDRTNSFGIPDGEYNGSHQFVAPSPKYGGDIMDGIRVK